MTDCDEVIERLKVWIDYDKGTIGDHRAQDLKAAAALIADLCKQISELRNGHQACLKAIEHGVSQAKQAQAEIAKLRAALTQTI